jgi:hypothetical protein
MLLSLNHEPKRRDLSLSYSLWQDFRQHDTATGQNLLLEPGASAFCRTMKFGDF